MFGTAVEQLEDVIDEILGVARSVEDVDVVRCEATEALLGLERQRERLEAAIACFVSDLEARGAHERDGAYSMANWLAARTGQRRTTAGSRVHLARKLRAMPLTGTALTAGEITASHASVLGRALNSRTAEAFAQDEGVLVESAKKLTADQLVQVVEFWLRHDDPDGPEPDGDRDRFHLSHTLDGRLKGDFDVGGDLAVTIKIAIDELVSQILARDKQCREADPIDPRLDETKLDNLVLLCPWHHRWVHAGNLTVTMVDGRPQFTSRDGQVLVEPRTGPDPPEVEAA